MTPRDAVADDAAGDPIASGDRTRLIGAGAVAALLLHAGLGIELTHRLATERVEVEERSLTNAACLEARLRAQLPRDAVVAIAPSEVWWHEQRLAEWATPDWELAEPRADADVEIALVHRAGGCAGIDVVVSPR